MITKKSAIPESTRVSFTASKEVIKGIKKFAIDFEVSEKEVPMIAIRHLLRLYEELTPSDIENGLARFLGEDEAKCDSVPSNPISSQVDSF